MIKKILSIAGFDASGGAGIQADLKTFSALDCYGMTVLTALPIQNTLGVKNCYELPADIIFQQLDVLFDDIIPDAIKIGMLMNADIIGVLVDFLKARVTCPIVIDPVLASTSGQLLLQSDAIELFKTDLMPLATILTPNLPEAAILLGCSKIGIDEMDAASKALLDFGMNAVLLKGGHLDGNCALDCYRDKAGNQHWLKNIKIETPNTHGTGCTLSAAIAAYLGLGFSLLESCERAKKYLSNAIAAARDQQIGHGAGPVHHFYHIWPAIDKI